MLSHLWRRGRVTRALRIAAPAASIHRRTAHAQSHTKRASSHAFCSSLCTTCPLQNPCGPAHAHVLPLMNRICADTSRARRPGRDRSQPTIPAAHVAPAGPVPARRTAHVRALWVILRRDAPTARATCRELLARSRTQRPKRTRRNAAPAAVEGAERTGCPQR